MKMIVAVTLALVAVTAAVPVAEPIKIIKSELLQNPEGSYTLSVETENGIVLEQVGELKSVLDENKEAHNVIVVKGSYSYPGLDGPETVNYVSDENGYRAEGRSVPKAVSRR